MERMISFPKNEQGEFTAVQVPYDQLLNDLKGAVDQIPGFIAAMKRADNAGFQDLVTEVTAYAERNPELVSMIRVEEVDGKEALRIGEPNWIILPLLIIISAFGVGFIVGYELGYDGSPGYGGSTGGDETGGGEGGGGGADHRHHPLDEEESE